METAYQIQEKVLEGLKRVCILESRLYSEEAQEKLAQTNRIVSGAGKVLFSKWGSNSNIRYT